MMRNGRWVQGLLLLGFLLFLTVGCGTTTPEATSPKEGPVVGLKIGNVAPDFSISMLDGKTITLSELRGKPVFLNFWATWCPPCNLEMPDIEKAYKDNFPVQIIGINIKESPMAVGSFLNQKGYTFPVGFDLKGQIAGQYMATGIPTSYAIDALGRIRYVQTGPLTYAQLRQWFTDLSQTTK
ncbi:MAG: TlpA disulfide reductase family protein [Desulfitobacteriaceae bacterium]|nr:TlpA disulfide reductase family protein [Desulfitobacteriaceae bacterium]MDI6879909.1 TlpA disulfide reductase family protein [Desulfitobacteriaceae bacterium]MDI6915431.1 TlpA disulfide reductase family protein [Desulfitobacteriaceae bacterium]